MGVEPFLVASSLIATVSQRLVRLTCSRCAMPYRPEAELVGGLGCGDLLTDPNFQFQRGAGCDMCSRTGYKGRTGAYEMMEVDAEVQRLIMAQATTQEIKAAALSGSRTLREDAVLKIRQAITTPEEVARVTIA